MARLPKGTPKTPVKVRLKGYQDDLKARGGRRLIVDLEKPPHDALKSLKKHTDASYKDLVSEALIYFEKHGPKPTTSVSPSTM